MLCTNKEVCNATFASIIGEQARPDDCEVEPYKNTRQLEWDFLLY
jgi:hypothetical protein